MKVLKTTYYEIVNKQSNQSNAFGVPLKDRYTATYNDLKTEANIRCRKKDFVLQLN